MCIRHKEDVALRFVQLDYPPFLAAGKLEKSVNSLERLVQDKQDDLSNDGEKKRKAIERDTRQPCLLRSPIFIVTIVT